MLTLLLVVRYLSFNFLTPFLPETLKIDIRRSLNSSTWCSFNIPSSHCNNLMMASFSSTLWDDSVVTFDTKLMLPMLMLRIDEGDEHQYGNYAIVHWTLVGQLGQRHCPGISKTQFNFLLLICINKGSNSTCHFNNFLFLFWIPSYNINFLLCIIIHTGSISWNCLFVFCFKSTTLQAHTLLSELMSHILLYYISSISTW